MKWVYQLKNVTVERSKGGASFRLTIPEFHIPRGSFTAIVGQSGCGKSTLLDILGLVLSPSSADTFNLVSRYGESFEIAGQSAKCLSQIRRHHLGYILQSGGLMPFLSVAGNILLARMLNPKTASDPEKTEELIFRLGLEDHLKKKPSQLSGGQRQRAAIARAVAQNPEIILADEPTGSVDKYTAAKIRDLLLQCAREQDIAVLIVTHDESLVSGIADATYSFELAQRGDGDLRSVLQKVA